MTPANAPDDGPWRISTQFRVAVLAEVGDLGAAAAAARVGAAFLAAGLPLAEARALAPGRARAALHRAATSGVDLLLLDAATLISPEAASALRRAAEADPMVAAALPRFAVSCAEAVGETGPTLDYSLLPDRRATYVKASALTALGDMPTSFGEDDVAGPLLALNRVGFRVVVAGDATAFHPEGANSIVADVVPDDWRPALARRSTSAPALADALLQGLRPAPDGRRAIAFDLSHAGPNHSGTTHLARALTRRAAARWTDLALFVVASPKTFAFHFADLGSGVTRVDPADQRVFAALVRFGQPFLWGEVDAALRRAPVLVMYMLDTIGFDCQHDAPDEIDALWRFCIGEADGLLFNSAFTARQYTRRFGPPTGPALTSLHSLDLADYRLADLPLPSPDGGILLIGNAMAHKRLRDTAQTIADAALGRPIAALGLAPGAVPGVQAVASGSVTPERMAALYASAAVVVYPSVYEGFGFPILDALAHRRPVLARDLPPYREIAAVLPERANIHVFRDDADLLRRLATPPAWSGGSGEGPVRGWDAAADDLRGMLDVAVGGASRARVIRRIDMLRGRMSFMRARAFGDADDADELDRLASLSGRMVSGTIRWIGRHVPGTRASLAALHHGFDRLRGGRAR